MSSSVFSVFDVQVYCDEVPVINKPSKFKRFLLWLNGTPYVKPLQRWRVNVFMTVRSDADIGVGDTVDFEGCPGEFRVTRLFSTDEDHGVSVQLKSLGTFGKVPSVSEIESGLCAVIGRPLKEASTKP